MLKQLTLTPETTDIIGHGGKIERSWDYWSLRWTTQSEGYQEIDRKINFTNPQDALPKIAEILQGQL